MSGPSTLLSAPQDPKAGDVVAQKYRLERCLGEGGQGCVWRAENLVLELPVAIKLVHPEDIHGLVPERLFREARAAATLGHPAIVRVFDIGRTSEGLPFLVMELLRGESLADELTRTARLSPTRALQLLLPIADGLVAAHAERIVHRDVKPDNIFVAVSGDWIQPKLLDFGLARRSMSSDRLGRLTDAGAVLGTPAYLSPEQASGRGEVDERADVWSFCATLYECLTGSLPFRATSWHQLRRQILQAEPTTLQDHGVDDAELWQILRRGLAKSPDARWSTMQELGRALACWLLERGVTSDICGAHLEARWLRSDSAAVSPKMERPDVPSPPRRQTLRIEKSTTRRRAAATRRSKPMAAAETRPHPPTLHPPPRRRRLLYGAAVVFGCIALSALMTATQRTREPGGGIIASSRAAALPALNRGGHAARTAKPSGVPTPVVSPAAEPAASAPAAPAVPPSARNAAVSQRSAPALQPSFARPLLPEAAPAAEVSRPAEPKAPRQKTEPLDLMEPY